MDSYLSDHTDRCSAQASSAELLPPLRVRYEFATLDQLLGGSDVLAVIGFGSGAPMRHDDPRYLHVALEPLAQPAPFEVWRGGPIIIRGAGEALTWISDGDYSFGALSLDEAEHGGIAAAACHGYRALSDWIGRTDTPQVLRIWNYLDAINSGDGDSERYREFCHGRAEGMRGAFDHGFPAATATGTRSGGGLLQIYWLAARARGTALENPRQVSAWRYPRQYGPSAPTFARAMRAPTHSPQLYISGTAAIVGHASHHGDDFAAQVDETLANLTSLLAAADYAPAARFGSQCQLKAYVRRDADARAAAETLRARLPAATPLLLLHSDICRRELLIEIDGIQST